MGKIERGKRTEDKMDSEPRDVESSPDGGLGTLS